MIVGEETASDSASREAVGYSGGTHPTSAGVNAKCGSFPTSACRLIKDLESEKKSKADAAAAALGQFIATYLGHGLNDNRRNGSAVLNSNNLERCCKNLLGSIWDVLTGLEPAVARNVLKYTKVATVLEYAPEHLHHATLRSHIAEKERGLMLSRQLHGVPVPALATILQEFSHLHRLDLSHNALTEDDIPDLCNALRCFSALLHLDLSSNSIGEDGAEALAEALVNLRHLKLLCLNSTLLEDEGIAHISRAIATPLDIRHLSLAKCGITSEGAESLKAALQALPKLSHLDLQGNDLQGDGIVAVCDGLQTPRLSFLDVSENSLGSEGINALAAAIPRLSVSHLHHLDLSGNGLEADDAAALGKVLEATAPSLTSLILADNDLQDWGLESLQRVLSSMHALRSLNVAGNELSSEGSRALFAALNPLTSLRKLDISYQPSLGGTGVQAFAIGVHGMKSLHALMLISVGLDATSVASLARALPDVCTLTSLHLSHNSLGAEGAASLFNAVAKMPSLTHVSVGYADLGPRCAQTLGPSIQKASQVHFLDLRYNALRVQGTMALVQHLRHLRALKSVVLEGNGVEEPDDVMAVEKSLRGVRVWLNVGARIA